MKDSTGADASAPVKLTAAQIAQLARKQRARDLVRRVAIWVLLPTALAGVYLFAIARDQYESLSTVMVRDGNAAHIVMLEEFLLSRDMLGQLDQKQSFSEHFVQNGDFVFGLSRQAGNESRFKVFRRFVSVSHDSTTGVMTVAARAFSPRVANLTVQAMVQEGEAFLARQSAAQAQSPLVIIARPSLPNESSYPRRLYGVLTAFFVSLSVFVICSLLIAAVREHAQF